MSRVLPQIIPPKSEATHVTSVREQGPYLTDRNVILASTKNAPNTQLWIIFPQSGLGRMGVKGLWQLLQPTGHPVSLDSLEGKVLGVDVSLWLHQAVKGMRDQEGGALDNAHLLSLFHRICKLLFYRIKPVFVFDGGVPLLKRQTLSLRRQRKEEAESSSEKATRKIVSNQLKQHALNAVLGVATGNTAPSSSWQPDLFELPPLPETEGEEPQAEEQPFGDFPAYDDLQCVEDVDLESEDFLSLPSEIQHELLTELKESRRRTCWAKLDTLPQASVDFSNYQLAKLRRQNKLTQKIESVRRDMNAKTSGDIALSLAGDVSRSQIESHKVMSEDGAHYILVTGLSKVKDHVVTLDDASNNVIPFCDRVTNVTRDRHLSEDRTCLDRRHGDRCDTPPGVTDRKHVEGEELVIVDGDKVKSDINDGRVKESDIGYGLGISERTSDDRMMTGIDLTQQDDAAGDKVDTVDDTTVKSPSRDTDQRDMSSDTDTESPGAVDSDIERTASTECVWKRQENDDSFVLTTDIVAVETPASGHDADTDDITCQDRQNDTERKMERFTDEQMKEQKDSDSDSESDGDFIEVRPVTSETTVQSAAVTISDDTDGDTSGQSPSDQCPPVSADQPDSPVADSGNIFEGLSQRDLEALQGALQADTAKLEQERGQQQRAAATVTGQMYTEAQELLQLFGVPYMTSPLEAEAQCAYLDMTRQTEGSITDDSDIWLFGAEHVYRNVFNQSRDVEFYKMADIRAHLLLDRAQCISLALLCGSDYTDGIAGVGPVTAMEILAEFSGEGIERLERFRDWWLETQKTHKIPHETKIKGQLRRLQLHPGFPSRVVSDAYLTPAVDESREAFHWSLPDLDQLREYTKTRFGWTRQKVDESLLPILKRLSETQSQRNITTYFPLQMTQPKRLKSKRVKAVLNRIRTPCATSPQRDVTSKTVAVKAKRRRKNGGKVTGGGEATAAAGGFLCDGKPEVTSEVVLSESSSGSDSDGGATNRIGQQLNSRTEKKSSALMKGRGLDTARRQKKT